MRKAGHGREADDDGAAGGSAPQETADGITCITEAEATTAAMAHAGVSADGASDLECELENEGGRTVYDVSFTCGGFEYNYKFDTVTGVVVTQSLEAD